MRDYVELMQPAAAILLGEPNPRLSNAKELRWGRHGSFAVNLNRGTWFDFEAGTGGGLLALIARETGATTPAKCLQWLRNAGLLPGDTEFLTRADLATIEARRSRERAARSRAERLGHAQNAKRAMAIWDAAKPARPEHGYLRRKRVDRHGAREYRGLVVLPVVDFDSTLWSLQFIEASGVKRLLKGGRKAGNHIPVHEPAQPSRLLLCEGWATGASLSEMEPDARVLAAIDAGNLLGVAVSVRRRWKDAEIVVCCDRDDSGIRYGKAAAIAAGALVAVPEFPEGVSGTDYNDLACWLAERTEATV